MDVIAHKTSLNIWKISDNIKSLYSNVQINGILDFYKINQINESNFKKINEEWEYTTKKFKKSSIRDSVSNTFTCMKNTNNGAEIIFFRYYFLVLYFFKDKKLMEILSTDFNNII